MDTFKGKFAVVTGGGTGMGRELARQLAAEGCHVAICDVSDENMAETVAACEAESPQGTRVTSFVADVSEEADLVAFRDHVVDAFGSLDLLFNNAGIGGAGSVLADPREEWEQVFNVCWGGVYLGVRTFLPLLVKSPAAWITNTSSVNGFWATIGPQTAHTAYSAAKFAVKGFSEALITDLRLHAPNVGVSVVMPGHIGTSIVFNSGAYFGRDPKELDAEQVAEVRERLTVGGIDLSAASDEDVRGVVVAMAEGFRDNAPMTAAAAATVILDGVRAGRWRILVGDDAHALDEAVRADPEHAYEPEFLEALQATGVFAQMPAVAEDETQGTTGSAASSS
jgi:NAD(P)-dependent dehydrogenase (short-subunit alcohol dehydrogenase family)